MRRRYVHIVGMSCVGKQSLIRRLLLPEAGALRRRLGLGRGTLAAYGYAFDPGDIRRATADIVLHQWQWATDHLVLAAEAERPGWRHEALVLWKPPEEHVLDILLHRRGWRPTVAELEAQWRGLAAHVAAWMARDIRVRVLDARTWRFVRPSPARR